MKLVVNTRTMNNEVYSVYWSNTDIKNWSVLLVYTGILYWSILVYTDLLYWSGLLLFPTFCGCSEQSTLAIRYPTLLMLTLEAGRVFREVIHKNTRALCSLCDHRK